MPTKPASGGMKGGFFSAPKAKPTPAAKPAPAPAPEPTPEPETSTPMTDDEDEATTLPDAPEEEEDDKLQSELPLAWHQLAEPDAHAHSSSSWADPEGAGAEPNEGNGGTTDTYSWVQTLQDVSVNVPLPAGTKAKMMDVVIKKKALKVGLKGQPPIFDVRSLSRVSMADA